MSTLYNRILNAIPLHVGETFIERDVREEIAKAVENALKDDCEHEWKTISQVKIIQPHVCKKCGKIKYSYSLIGKAHRYTLFICYQCDQ